MLVLIIVIRRMHENPSAPNVNLIAIEVQELHQDIAIMLHGIHGPRLDLGHGLQNVRDQTNRGEATNAATEDLVDSTHDQQLFDHSDEGWQGRVFLFPGLECFECWEPRVVLKGDVNFDTRTLIGELHNRHLGPSNKSDRVGLCESEPVDVLGDSSQLVLGLADETRSAALERFR